MMAKKQAEEDDFREKMAANPEWQKEYGGAWDTIAKAEEKVKPEIKSRFSAAPTASCSRIALQLVQYAAEMKKPDGERLAQFHDAAPAFAEVPVAIARADYLRDTRSCS